MDAMRNSFFFDRLYYFKRYAINLAAQSAEEHFLETGIREGFQPSPYFNPREYLLKNQDVASAGINPFYHFVVQGCKEIRYTTNYFRFDGETIKTDIDALAELFVAAKVFDDVWYARHYPEVAQKNITALEHYMTFGIKSDNAPNAMFDPQFYLRRMPVAATLGWNPLLHYLLVGTVLDVDPHPLFASAWYRAKYAIDQPNISTLSHFQTIGRERGYDPCEAFVTKHYIAQRPDAAAWSSGPVAHYMEVGHLEGANPSAGFNTAFYLRSYEDVKSSGLNPLVHYHMIGKAEGRQCLPVDSPDVAKTSSTRHSLIEPELIGALSDPLIFDPAFYRYTHDFKGTEGELVIDFLARPMRPASAYFDPVWYLEQNAEAGPAGLAPLKHYLNVGRAKQLKPSRFFDGKRVEMPKETVRQILEDSGLFDPEWYRHRHADIARAGVNPLAHYAEAGHKEHTRSPNVLFDSSWYAGQSPEVRQYGWNPLVHYALVGASKSLSTHPLFDARWVEKVMSNDSSSRTPLGWLLKTGLVNGVGPNEFFDPQFYRMQHPESAAHPGGALGHYIDVGWKDKFDPSERFSTQGYLLANADVNQKSNNPLVHFITNGRVEGRSPKPSLDTRSAPSERFSESEYGAVGPLIRFDAEDVSLPDEFALSIAVHLHLYYVEMAEEFCRYLQNIPATFHLFVSVPDGRGDPEALKAVFAKHLPLCANVIVRSTVNRGRDVAPFLVEFGEELLKYDLVLHMHSKRSPHSPSHADWRRYLLHYAVGNRSVVTQILTAFYADPKIGMFQPPYHPQVRAQPKWGGNREASSQLLLRLGLSYVGDTCPDFPAGSFFWARTNALRPLLDGRFRLDDFHEEGGQTDGTTAHALERLFGLVPVLRGYTSACRYIDVAHNLINYYGKNRPFRGFERDRTDDIYEYQAAARNRLGKRARIAVVVAIIGPFDTLLLPQHLEPDIDYFCVSDSVKDGYGVFRVLPPTYVDADPRRTARYVKTNLLRLFPGYEFVVWVDGNVLVRSRVTDFVKATEASGCSVGAIPHPTRRSYLEEAAVAIELSLDEPEIIKAQLKAYEGTADLEAETLIETNFMVLDARKPATHDFMRNWCNEISTYSRRDQLSINFSLRKAGVKWHPLLAEYLSVRDSPAFSLFRHGMNDWGPKPSIYAAWHKPHVFDGHLLPLHANHRWSKQAGILELDVVVCVHNALDDVRACLLSVETALDGRGGLVIVNDASESETAEFLREFAARLGARLVENEHRLGYTKAANLGVRASTAKNVLLLNSDTIVPPMALDKLADTLQRDPLLGIVGPLSNAASWQSVPSTTGTASQTAVNALPAGMSVADMDLFLEQRWDGRVIRTPLVHGFCFCVKRAVFDAIGLFDEENFPSGYGEENDFCFRAADAGFDLGVLTSTFVFHAKSKSYKDGERTRLMDEGMQALVRKATKPRITRSVDTMRLQPALIELRKMVAPLFETAVSPGSVAPRAKKGRLFILPSRRSDGLPAGSGYVRALLPYKSEAVRRDWDVTELRSGALPELSASDTILVQREGNGIESSALDSWISLVIESGARLVYEVDDDLLDADALSKRGFKGDAKDLANRVLQLARAAHCVTVSSSALKVKLEMHNSNVVFVPNALDADLWGMRDKSPFPPMSVQRPQGRRIRIGYVGTPTHDQDLTLVTDVITGLQERYPDRLDVQVIGGFGNKKTFGSPIALPAANDYPSFVRWLRANVTWDIGIIPLASNSFNAKKSYLKFLECGALGMALVCSRGPEYSTVVRHEENGLLVPNTKEAWDAALTRLITNVEDRERLARKAYEDVRSLHLVDHLAETLSKVLQAAPGTQRAN
jgi:GT2 family glycosyltransferase